MSLFSMHGMMHSVSYVFISTTEKSCSKTGWKFLEKINQETKKADCFAKNVEYYKYLDSNCVCTCTEGIVSETVSVTYAWSEKQLEESGNFFWQSINYLRCRPYPFQRRSLFYLICVKEKLIWNIINHFLNTFVNPTVYILFWLRIKYYSFG